MLDYNEIDKVTRFAVRKYNVNIPRHMSLDEFCHEVKVFMFRKCKLDKPGAAAIIKNVIWTSHELFDNQYKEAVTPPPINFRGISYRDHIEDNLDNLTIVKQILSLKFPTQERSILEFMVKGLDTREILNIMGFSRQRLNQIKKSAFEKVLTSPIGEQIC